MKRCINTHDNANKNNIHNLTGGKLKYRRCQVSKNIYQLEGFQNGLAIMKNVLFSYMVIALFIKNIQRGFT